MAVNSRQSEAENAQQRREKRELEERIRFEELLCALSATFLNSPLDAMDKGIEHGLELIVRFLGADRGVVMQFSEDRRTLKVTHSYIAPSGKPLPFMTMTEGERLLWYTEALMNQEMVVLENLPDDLPEEASVERRLCIEQGLKSHICIPLSVGRASPRGAIGFGYMHQRQTWPMPWLRRVQFVGHILTFALMRGQTEKALHKALCAFGRPEKTEVVSKFGGLWGE